MATVTQRYDRHALRYGRWWAPVLRPTALRLLDEVGLVLGDAAPARVIDVGTGTGVLALAGATRWPTAEIVAVDGSTAMLAVARREMRRRLPTADHPRISWRTALADALPAESGTFDLAISSFVLQLVPDRLRALREARRVLRPGGTIAYVTWLDGEDDFTPQARFEDLVEEETADEGIEPEEARSGDLASPAAAAAQLRRAGFSAVRVRRHWLEHRWTAESYLAFLEHYDAADIFDSLGSDARTRLRERTAAAFAGLPSDAFAWRTPVVFAVGRVPGTEPSA